MRINKFIKKLNKLYRPIKSKQFLVKYWAQPTSFSFAVYSADNAFTGSRSFDSEIYHFWDKDTKVRKKIFKDVNKALKALKNVKTIPKIKN